MSKIPNNYTNKGTNELLDLVKKDIVITVHERVKPRKDLNQTYEYHVIGSKGQKKIFEGSYQERKTANRKAIELAEKH